jgi:hypothetical protein
MIEQDILCGCMGVNMGTHTHTHTHTQGKAQKFISVNMLEVPVK